MEFLALWLGTSIASFCMEMINEFRLFKDVADAGYKINMEKMSELGKLLNPNASKISFLSMIIPIYNILTIFQKTIQYNNARPMLLDQLSVMDVLEEMSELEKQEYSKKPTGLNAILTPLKVELRLEKAISIKINNDNENSEIFYETGNSLDDIIILKVNGDAARLTLEEQKKKVIDTWKNIAEAGIEKYGDKNSFVSAFSTNTILDLVDSVDDNTEEKPLPIYELSISEQKQALENLRNELEDQRETTQQLDSEEKPKLIKKR